MLSLKQSDFKKSAELTGSLPRYWLRHGDGRWIRILARGRTTERCPGGRSVGVIGTHLDSTARHAAEEAGRDPAELKCFVCAPSKVSDDIAQAREEVRWFPAMVGNHVADIIRVHGEGGNIPRALTDYVRDRDKYDYKDHSRVGAAHGSFVTDEICDRFTVIGSASDVVAKLRELESIGVDEWIVYLMTNDQEETLEAYGRDVIPALSS